MNQGINGADVWALEQICTKANDVQLAYIVRYVQGVQERRAIRRVAMAKVL